MSGFKTCLEIQAGDFKVELRRSRRKAAHPFSVSVGVDSKGPLSYDEAVVELGSAVMACLAWKYGVLDADDCQHEFVEGVDEDGEPVEPAYDVCIHCGERQD
jgi:hypothetical protein